MARHYHVGSNMVGYMPDSDVFTVRTKRDAIAGMREDVAHYWASFDSEDDRPYKSGRVSDGDIYVYRDREPTTLPIHFWVSDPCECDEGEQEWSEDS